jgi:hypothetical protein
MKNGLVLSAIFGAAFLYIGCSKKLMPEGRFQDKPVVVDGKIDDWELPLRFSDPSYSMQYAVTNDNKNIYVCIYTKDQAFQLRMLRAGMSICFDPKGEKNKNMSLVFPIRKSVVPVANGNGEPIRSSDIKMTEEQFLLQSDFYNTTGLLNLENGQFAVADRKNNIQLAIKLNSDSSLVYEAAIPIRYVLGNDLRPGNVSQNISVGLIINAIHSPSQNPNGGYHSRSSYGGGMRGMHGGGRNYGSNNNPPAKPEEDWYQFRLVYKKV